MSHSEPWVCRFLVAFLILLASPVVAETPEVSSFGLIDIVNAKMPFEHVLVGGQPTLEQLKLVAEAGYGTVINLRGEGEHVEWDEKAEVEALGMRFVSIAIAGKQDLTETSAQRLSQALKDATGAPMLVHCGSGNRVGALFALKAFYVDGEPAEKAMAIGKEAGLRSLATAVEQHFVSENPQQ